MYYVYVCVLVRECVYDLGNGVLRRAGGENLGDTFHASSEKDGISFFCFAFDLFVSPFSEAGRLEDSWCYYTP